MEKWELTLSFYNTLSGKIEPFKPIMDNEVKIYTCGPSTYLRPHIGNYRTFLYEDILQRYLEYLGYKVTRLMTLTDVEDKAIVEAEKENISIEELTTSNENVLFRDFALLKIKVPDYTVRASSAINQAVWLVKTLVKNGYAYWHIHDCTKNAYFDPLKFAGFGKLAKIDMNQWPKRRRRFHKDTYPGTPWNRGDFILWHGCGEKDVCWETEIGAGRPAWNVQDAAIVTEHFGFAVDVAAGGIDNLVRHHDYTLAIAESVSGKNFAKYWLHGAHLFVNNQKMSKSKGNVYYPDDLIARGYEADHLRLFLVYHHYRKKLNFTWEKLDAVCRKLDELKKMVENLRTAELGTSSEKAKALITRVSRSFEESMNSDLDVRTAFDKLFENVEKLHKLNATGCLSAGDANAALNILERVDHVLKVIF